MEMFESEWDQRSLYGWETAIARMYGESVEEVAERLSAAAANEDEEKQEGEVKK